MQNKFSKRKEMKRNESERNSDVWKLVKVEKIEEKTLLKRDNWKQSEGSAWKKLDKAKAGESSKRLCQKRNWLRTEKWTAMVF